MTSLKENEDRFSGLAYLKQAIGRPSNSPMSTTMMMELVAAEDGSATFEARPDERFFNPQGRLHGGYAATLIDSTLGCAVQTKLPAKIGYGTIDLKVSYVGKIDLNSIPLTCTAHVLHAGRTMCTAEAKLIDRNGKLVAHGTGTFLVYPK
ncbi:PaaI family thioesterase [Aestuariivirga sp.]|uniref:PaaI family thioesterase n=1 Tax=Aestuariivirga sp. TaxID=2650926 RepID=UPI0039E49E65